jgi:predicted ATPase/DNA-binding winged helix-turn-helix (wHTH) protein
MPPQSQRPVYQSGECEIDLARRELRASGTPVPVGGRAFEILEVLVLSAGQLVTKNALMDRVWHGAIVEENTLQVHISAVRKALGPFRNLLKTEAGRGYRLLGTWTARLDGAPSASVDPEPTAPRGDQPFQTNFPGSASELIGRDDAAQQLLDLLSAYRAVTLTGPGGIGKTALALEVARKLFSGFGGDGWLVELASLSNPDLVPSAVASVLGLKLSGAEISPEAVARNIGDRKLLLVLDNCEHVVDVAAQFAETVLRLTPSTTVLATSREVLRIEGEYVYRVPPLGVPPEQPEDPSDVLEHGAVQLFIAKMQALDSDFVQHAESLPAIAAICRHLDGIPLAIEFAAARAATLGISRVGEGLNDRFGLLTGGRRTALPRHQTLRAALDWSYDLLPEPEQRLLRHLAVFAAGFTLDAAIAVLPEADNAPAVVVEGVVNLVTKSLVTLDGSARDGRWRMLETIRAYALAKLVENGEFEAAARRHAEYQRDRFGLARVEWESQPTAAWVAEYGHRLDDLRAALDWAFSPSGDEMLGVMLTVDAVPLWLQFSLMNECHRRVEQALARLGAETDENARLRMRLSTALGLSRMYLREPFAAIRTAWSATLALAEQLGDVDYQLRALWGAFAASINTSNFRVALEVAERFRDVTTDPTDRLIGERIIGTALHFLGQQSRAREHIEYMLAHYAAPANSAHIIRFQNDQGIAARRVLAPILWLQGFSDQAMRMVEAAVADSVAINHALTLCNLLGQSACPLAFLVGDLDAAERFTALLIEQADRHSLAVWQAYGGCFAAMLLIRRGDYAAGVARLRAASDELRRSGFTQYYTPCLAALAEGLGGAGQAAAGIAVIDESLERAEETEERWCLAELLRIKGELLLQQAGDQSVAAAEDCFAKALDMAREQGTLSWELRAASSLARLRSDQGRHAEARQSLAAIYEKFAEGFATADLQAARAVLDTR